MARKTIARTGRPVQFITDYAEQVPADDSLVIPEDLTTLSQEDLDALQVQAVEAFTALYQNGDGDLSEDDLSTLGSLTEGIEVIGVEVTAREAASTERREAAAALAARVTPAEETDEAGDGEADAPEGEAEGDEDVENVEEAEEVVDEDEAALVAGARKEIRVNLPGLRSRQARREAPAPVETGTMRDIVHAAPDTGIFANGAGMDFNDMGRAVDHRLTGFNKSTYEAAARSGKAMRQQFGVATIAKPYREGLRIDSSDPEHVESVFAKAVDQTSLPGGSLVASGGWCAPSETMYDLFEVETRDGLFSIPEINVARGGFRFTQGPNFSDLFSAIEGFHYTEAEDIAGDYDGAGGGSKPCYKIECPEFEEVRLELDGLCLTAGLLQQRGYPEVIARTIRGALVAHDHRLSGLLLTRMAAGSDAVTMPAGQAGAVAPLLTSIELQVEHYRTVNRISRNTAVEAVFPFWIRGAIRSDLARRLGVDLISVPNSRIDGWFRDAGVAPQFVYNYNDIGGTAAAMTSWPASVKFLLYAAGTWVKGGSDVITLDTIYDSTLLGTNDYTALFTEEGWLVAKRGHDSREVTVNLCADGATHGGVDIDCDGSTVVATG